MNWLPKIGGIVLIVGGLLISIPGLLEVARDLKESGPTCETTDAPRGAAHIEVQNSSHYIGLLPLGLYCVWNMADGTKQTQLMDPLGVTYFAYGGAIVTAGGIASLAIARGQRR